MKICEGSELTEEELNIDKSDNYEKQYFRYRSFIFLKIELIFINKLN
jgi:hypothetical protein